MAQYGIDIYGKTRYGPSAPSPQFSVEPFTVTQVDYSKLAIGWANPTSGIVADWQTFRLVRNTHGYPANENDGRVLYEATPETLRRSYEDLEIVPGRYYYYAVFLTVEHPDYDAAVVYGVGDPVTYEDVWYMSLTTDNLGEDPSTSAKWRRITDPVTWYRSAVGVGLLAKDSGYSDALYEAVPRPYRTLDGREFEENPNRDLRAFLDVFAFQLDGVRARYDALSHINSADRTYAGYLDPLAQQFGFTHERFASPRLRRLRLKTVSSVTREKGTASGLRAAINAITGWDAEIETGKNHLLHQDQADFLHPRIADWNKDIRYAVGERAVFGAYVVECVVSSRGATQSPSGNGNANTWWKYLAWAPDTTGALNNPATGSALSTWGVRAGAASVGLVVGASDPEDTVWDGNAGVVTVTTGGSATVSSAVPVQASAWTGGSYKIGSYVARNGVTWRAVRDHTNVEPGTDPATWVRDDTLLAPAYDRAQILRSAIPVPSVVQWSQGTIYFEGDIVETPRKVVWDPEKAYPADAKVIHNGHLWGVKTNGAAVGAEPGVSTAWEDGGTYPRDSAGRRYRALVDSLNADPEALPVTYGSRAYGFGFYGGLSPTAGWEYLGDADDSWCASMYLRGAAAGAQAKLTIDWYAEDGTRVTTSDPDVQNDEAAVEDSSARAVGTNWTRVWVSARPPQRTEVDGVVVQQRGAYAVINLVLSGVADGGKVYLRKAQFEVATAPTDWEPPRQAIVKFKARRVNECLNPSFETNTDGWTSAGGVEISRSSTNSWDPYGEYALEVSGDSTAGGYVAYDNGHVLPGEWLTASGFVKALDGVDMQPSLVFKNSDGAIVSTVTASKHRAEGSAWERVHVTGKAPSNAVAFEFRLSPSYTDADTYSALLDAVLIERSETLGDYFDGSIFSADFIWEGTPHASRSHYYEGFRDKQYRLMDIVQQNVPYGTPVRLLYAQPE